MLEQWAVPHVVEFELARADNGRKLILVHASSDKELKEITGRSRLYISDRHNIITGNDFKYEFAPLSSYVVSLCYTVCLLDHARMANFTASTRRTINELLLADKEIVG